VLRVLLDTRRRRAVGVLPGSVPKHSLGKRRIVASGHQGRPVAASVEPLLCCQPMNALAQLWQEAPDDPLVLVGWLLAVWFPVCAIGLGVLAALASLQYRFAVRRRPRPAIVVPPLDARPLVSRRIMTGGYRGNVYLAAARVSLLVVVVLGFTALILAATGPVLWRNAPLQ
jgi:hypothetical protein